jgi:hypothetical protein
VLRQRDGGPAGQQRDRELVAHQLAVQPGQDALGRLVGADRTDEVVQPVVEGAVATELAGIDRAAHEHTDLVELDRLLVGDPPGGLRGDETLEHHAHLRDLDRIGQRDLADVRALVALHLHQSFGGEVLQSRAHHEPAHAEPFAQRRLHEALPR